MNVVNDENNIRIKGKKENIEIYKKFNNNVEFKSDDYNNNDEKNEKK